MYKVLVADMDNTYAVMIRKLAEKELDEIKYCGFINSGRKLLLEVKENPPDILFLTIRLPEVNGIEAAKQIRKFNNRIHIVFITLYDYFEFALEAINVKADAYLIKPVEKEMLKKILMELIEQLAIERKREAIFNKKQETLNDSLRFVEYNFIYTVLFNGEYNNEMEKNRELLNLGTLGYIVNIEIHPQKKDKVEEMENNTYALYKCVKEIIEKHYSCAVGQRIVNRVFVYVSFTSADSIPKQDKVLQINEKIIECLYKELGLVVTIGAGSIRKITKLHISYMESLRCLRYENDKKQNIMSIDINHKKLLSAEDYLETEHKMLECIRLGQDKALDYFSDLLDMIQDLTEEDKKNKILELLVLACRSARIAGIKEDFYYNYAQLYQELQEARNEEINGFASIKFLHIVKAVRIRKAARLSKAVQNALNYIDNSYMDKIYLVDVANHVGLSPQYFSMLFRQEMSMNFVEYVTKLRIDKAVELLTITKDSIQEICYRVGFQDPNYFSRSFKKLVGSSPLEYKKRLNKARDKG